MHPSETKSVLSHGTQRRLRGASFLRGARKGASPLRVSLVLRVEPVTDPSPRDGTTASARKIARPGHQAIPRRALEELLRRFSWSPSSVWGLHAESEERQDCLGDDRPGDYTVAWNEQRTGEFRQDVPAHDRKSPAPTARLPARNLRWVARTRPRVRRMYVGVAPSPIATVALVSDGPRIATRPRQDQEGRMTATRR